MSVGKRLRPGFPDARLHRAVQLSRQPRRGRASLRHERFSRAARADRLREAASCAVVLFRLGRQRPHRPIEPEPRVLSGRRHRRAQPDRGARGRHQRADGGRRALDRQGLAAHQRVVLLGLRRRRRERRTRRAGSTRSSTSRSSPAARSASGTARVCAWRRPAPGLVVRSACCPTCALTRMKDSRTSSTPASSSSTAAWTWSSRRSCALFTTVSSLRFHTTAPLEALLFQSPVRQEHRRRLRRRRAVSPAAQREYGHHRGRCGAAARRGPARHLRRAVTGLCSCSRTCGCSFEEGQG